VHVGIAEATSVTPGSLKSDAAVSVAVTGEFIARATAAVESVALQFALVLVEVASASATGLATAKERENQDVLPQTRLANKSTQRARFDKIRLSL